MPGVNGEGDEDGGVNNAAKPAQCLGLWRGKAGATDRAERAGIGDFIATFPAGGNGLVFGIHQSGKQHDEQAKLPMIEGTDVKPDEDEEQREKPRAAGMMPAGDARGKGGGSGWRGIRAHARKGEAGERGVKRLSAQPFIELMPHVAGFELIIKGLVIGEILDCGIAPPGELGDVSDEIGALGREG